MPQPAGRATGEGVEHAGAFSLLRRPRFGFGALCIFLYVGAEVAIGSLIVNYLMQDSTMGLGEQDAGKHVPYYWGGAMVGPLHRRLAAARGLAGQAAGAVFAAGSIACIVLSINTVGAVSGWALLAVGLCNSIMFPTIFSLACEGLGVRAAEGSGIICVAIVGGAIVPLLTGWAADHVGLRLALLVPVACYAVITAYGYYARRPAPTTVPSGARTV